MAHFYLDESMGRPGPGDERELVGSEARHAVAVSRTRTGEPIVLGDGAGLVVRAVVVRVEPALLAYRVESVAEHPRATPTITLVQALAKGDRDELAVQAATELGVDSVIPWQARRSVSRWEGPKAVKGVQRWSTIAREAAKQSMRPWLPMVQVAVDTGGLAALAAGSRMLVLDPDGSEPLSALTWDDRDILVVVGPEGGIDPQELAALEAAGGERVRLGPEVLRTSTAGPAAIAVIAAALGRWGGRG